MYKMPEIDLSKCNLSEKEMMIAKVAIKGNKEVGLLRASKPKTPEKSIVAEAIYSEENKHLNVYRSATYKNQYATEEERIQALGCYVWRELAFCVSPISSHHCMPVCNDFNLEYSHYDVRRKEQTAFCENIVNKILKTIPIHQKHGLNRWTKVFGI